MDSSLCLSFQLSFPLPSYLTLCISQSVPQTNLLNPRPASFSRYLHISPTRGRMQCISCMAAPMGPSIPVGLTPHHNGQQTQAGCCSGASSCHVSAEDTLPLLVGTLFVTLGHCSSNQLQEGQSAPSAEPSSILPSRLHGAPVLLCFHPYGD